MLNSPVNGKIQGLFKAFLCFSSTFQGKFNFQGLLKTILYVQELFKPVGNLVYCKQTVIGTVFHDNMGCDTTKPVFGVSDKARFKPACSAIGIS